MQHALVVHHDSAKHLARSRLQGGGIDRPVAPAAMHAMHAMDAIDTMHAMPVRFGVEIEMQQVSLASMQAQTCKALRVPHAFVPSRRNHAYDVHDAQGRVWEIKKDAPGTHEMATPILQTRQDLDTLCRVAAAFSSAGACTLGACGLHIHVDAASFLPRDIVNIMALMALYQQPLEEVLQVRQERFVYCKHTDPAAVRALYDLRHLPRDEFCVQSLAHAGGRDRNINMTNLIERGKHTIEFRLFNATLDPTVITHYTSVVMGMVSAAKGAVDFFEALRCAQQPTLAQFCAAVGLDPNHGTGAFLLAQPRAAIARPPASPSRLPRRPSSRRLHAMQT